MYKSLPINLLTVTVLLLACLGSTQPSAVQAQGGFDCGTVTEIPQIQCEALVALYESTNGDNWTTNTDWVETNTPCRWYGVTCDAGDVRRLDLDGNQLSGAIPPGLGDLTGLTGLYLSYNRLSGAIPPELSNLANLEYLSLEVNELGGSIPSELGSLTKLQSLDLTGNQLAGSIPPELGNLTSLHRLQLGANQLSGPIPTELGNLSMLTWLDLYGNQLSGGIPPELGDLSALTILGLSSNDLSGSIPPELGDLAALQYLFANNNQLTGTIPSELGDLAALTRLELYGNQLNGAIPPEIGNLTALTSLWLSSNRLEGDVPETFFNLVNLADATPTEDALDLDYNFLNVPVDYPDGGDPLHVFLSQKDLDWHLRQGFDETLGPAGGELQSLDGKTHVLVPAGALAGDTTFTYYPQASPSQGTGTLLFANNSFLLEAEDGSGTPVTTFDPPLVVTIAYADDDIDGYPEDSLGLYYWDETGQTWMDAVTTCSDGAYVRDLEANTFSLPICHLSELALFGHTHRVYLPLVLGGY